MPRKNRRNKVAAVKPMSKADRDIRVLTKQFIERYRSALEALGGPKTCAERFMVSYAEPSRSSERPREKLEKYGLGGFSN